MTPIAMKTVPLMLLASSLASAQTTDAQLSGSTEYFEPEFDAAYTMRPRAGLFGITELMMAGLNGDYDTAVALIEAGADVNETDDSQSTALMWSAWSGNTRLVQLLLDNGADVNATAMNGANALGNALSSDRTAAAIALLQAGADPNALGDYSHPHLEVAARSDNLDVIDALIEKGVDIERFGPGALAIAAGKGNYEIAKRLIEAGTDVTRKGNNGRTTPLQSAVYLGDQKLVKLLLDNGARPDTAEGFVMPLRTAMQRGHLNIVRLLADSGAEIGIEELFRAISAGQTDIVDYMLEQVSIDNLSNLEIERLILLADSKGRQDLVRAFLATDVASAFDDNTVRLLFREHNGATCSVSLWNLADDTSHEIDSLNGHCDAQLFVADHTDTVFAIDGDVVHVVDLKTNAIIQSSQVPSELMAVHLDALKNKLREWRSDLDYDWMQAKPAAAGFLPGGEIAVGMHVGGPADGTYGYLFGLIDDEWELVREQSCHRFDWRCRFADLNGRPVDDWPTQRTVWHPYLQRNEYFVEKSREPNPRTEYGGEAGTIRMVIDGQPLTLRYLTSEGDHCADDCTYTTRLESHIQGSEPRVLAANAGNNAIASHYVLVGGGYNARPKLIDIRSGAALFDNLESATWIEGAGPDVE